MPKYHTIYESTNPVTGAPSRMRFNGAVLLWQEHCVHWKTIERARLNGVQARTLKTAVRAGRVLDWMDSFGPDLR